MPVWLAVPQTQTHTRTHLQFIKQLLLLSVIKYSKHTYKNIHTYRNICINAQTHAKVYCFFASRHLVKDNFVCREKEGRRGERREGGGEKERGA